MIVFSFEGTMYLYGSVVQLVSTPPCHGGGRGFESLLSRFNFGRLAQLGEHLPYKQGVVGSIPTATTIKDNFISRRGSIGRAADL